MVTTSLPAPSLTVRQQFARQVVATAQPLTSFLIGPAAEVTRYAQAAEKANGFLGTYNPVGTLLEGDYKTVYAWPGRNAGAVVDASFTRVYCENAFLRYYHDETETATRVDRNTIRQSNAIFQTNSLGTQNIGGRGAAIGDKVVITGVDEDDVAFTLNSYILNIKGDPVASAVAATVAGAGNAPVQSAAAVVAEVSGNSGGAAIAASGSYLGQVDGYMNEVYTVTVIQASASSFATPAKVKVVSASGTDDVASVDVATITSVVNIGTRGLTATFSADGGTDVALGDSWTMTVASELTATSVTTSGTYTGTKDRDYIVKVVTGGLISDGAVVVQVTSRDGSDTLPQVTVTHDADEESIAIPLGSYGLTMVLAGDDGLVTGDKYIIAASAATEGIKRRLQLAHDFPSNVETTTDAELTIQLFTVEDVEIPLKSSVSGEYQYASTATQLEIFAGATVTSAKHGGTTRYPILAPAGFGDVSQVYIDARYWEPAASAVVSVGPNDDLATLLPGPTDTSNPLKYALSLARGAAGGERVYIFQTGDPAVTASWEAGLNASSRIRGCYGHVPLTLDPAILDLCYAHAAAQNGDRQQRYRVLWTGSTNATGGIVLDSTSTDDSEIVSVLVEDNPAAAGTQYTLVRLDSDNVDFVAAGIRSGDTVRLDYVVDAWGDATYDTYTVDQVLSATTLTLTTSVGQAEAVGIRMEVYRTYNGADLVEKYSAEATVRPSDLVRYVLAPAPVIGGAVVPSYFVAAILAAMRSYQAPQRSLSTQDVVGISTVSGLADMGESELDRLAADGAMILYDDYDTSTVKVRHGVTTGATEILATREESMVSARHANLFAIVDRLKPYVAQINLSSDNSKLSERITAELNSLKTVLQNRNYTPELGGQLDDLLIDFVGDAAGLEDTLKIVLQMSLGRPGNYIDASVLIS